MLFCHITSRVEDDPQQNLLIEKGGNAFPYIVFMDSDGDVVMQYQEARTTAGFKDTAGAVSRYLYLRKHADSPNATIRADLLLTQLDLGVLGYEEAREKLTRLKGLDKFSESVSAEQRAQLDQKMINLEFQDFLEKLPQDKSRSETIEIAAKDILLREKRGEIPDGDAGMTFYDIVMMYGEQTEDVQMVEAAAASLKKQLDPQNERGVLVVVGARRRGGRGSSAGHVSHCLEEPRSLRPATSVWSLGTWNRGQLAAELAPQGGAFEGLLLRPGSARCSGSTVSGV